MKALCYIFIIIPLSVFAQDGIFIRWGTDFSFEKAKQRAMTEGKPIFIDCHATWCSPCKRMEQEVFTDKRVVDFVNNNFLPIRAQMDQTKFDNDLIRSWYKDAKYIMREYTVNDFPTFLILQPDGTPLHKIVGFKNVEDFLKETANSFDSKKQYFSVLKSFVSGKSDTSESKALARSFRNVDDVLAGKIAADYLSRIPIDQYALGDNRRLMLEFQQNETVGAIVMKMIKKWSKQEFHNSDNLYFLVNYKNKSSLGRIIYDYVTTLKDEEIRQKSSVFLLTAFQEEPNVRGFVATYLKELSKMELKLKENIELLSNFVRSSNDFGFKYLLANQEAINNVMGNKEYSSNIINHIITKEEIEQHLLTAIKENADPDWGRIKNRIEKKYPTRNSDRCILSSQVKYYKYITNKYNRKWPEFLEYSIMEVQKYGVDTSVLLNNVQLNNLAWYIFLHSNDNVQIEFAIDLIEGVVRRYPNNSANMDTYANLLYKLGKVQDAIKVESEVCKMDPSDIKYQQTLYKMKNGEPTWIDN